jgi:hypothetical protein
MQGKNNKLIIFYKDFIDWFVNESMLSHNNYIQNPENDYKAGYSFVFYEVYSLFQMQADAFNLSRKKLGISDFHENDFLSNSVMSVEKLRLNTQSLTSCIEKIALWLSDTIFLFEEDFYKCCEVKSTYNYGKREAYDVIMSKLSFLKILITLKTELS